MDALHDFSIVPNMVYAGDGHDVNTVIVDGKVLMKERRVLTMDEEDVLSKSQKTAERLIDRAGLDAKLKPAWPVT